MKDYIAAQDCVVPGVGIVREGKTVTLSARAAKYPVLKGRLAPAPVASEAPPAPKSRSRKARK